LTRRRGRPALHELLTGPCGIGGGGRVKDPAALAFEALRAVRREAAARPGAAVTLRAAPAVIAALENGPAAAARRALEKRLGRPLALTAEAAPPGEGAEIVLDT
jgi:Ribonuclease G/E